MGPLDPGLCWHPRPPHTPRQSWSRPWLAVARGCAWTQASAGLRLLGEPAMALACGPSTRVAPGAAPRGFWGLHPFSWPRPGRLTGICHLSGSRKRISVSCERLRALLPQFEGRREDMASVLEMSVQFLRFAGPAVSGGEQQAVSACCLCPAWHLCVGAGSAAAAPPAAVAVALWPPPPALKSPTHGASMGSKSRCHETQGGLRLHPPGPQS